MKTRGRFAHKDVSALHRVVMHRVGTARRNFGGLDGAESGGTAPNCPEPFLTPESPGV